MMSQKWFFGNYGIDWDILKVHDKKCLLAKNHYGIAIWGWDIGPYLLQWLHTNPRLVILCGSNPVEPRQNYKDLYGVIGARKGQYLIPKLQ